MQLSLSLSHTHTHTHTHARPHARKRWHTEEKMKTRVIYLFSSDNNVR